MLISTSKDGNERREYKKKDSQKIAIESFGNGEKIHFYARS